MQTPCPHERLHDLGERPDMRMERCEAARESEWRERVWSAERVKHA